MEIFTTLEAILLSLKKEVTGGGTSADWDRRCLYAAKPLCAQSRYQLTDRCCLAAGTPVDNDDVEHLPPEIETMGLGLYCYGKDLVDVVESADRATCYIKSTRSAQKLIRRMPRKQINIE